MDRKSSKMKRILGTGKNKDRDQVAEIRNPGYPDYPKGLVKREKEIFDFVCSHLEDYELLSISDGLVISLLAKSYVRLEKAEREVKSKGAVTVSQKTGYSTLSGYYLVMREETKICNDYLDGLGLTLKGRQDLKVFLNKKTQEDDPFEALRKKTG